jgi:HSP20 family protein
VVLSEIKSARLQALTAAPQSLSGTLENTTANPNFRLKQMPAAAWGGPQFRRITMHIARYEPWSLLKLLQQDFGQLAGRRYGFSTVDEDNNSVADFVPPVDVIEENDRFVLRADLPGVSPEHIAISMENGSLSLNGERQTEKSENVDGLHRFERGSGKFYRRFSLPESADSENISAKSANGILEIVIPKKPQVHSRRITVEAA